MPLSKWGKMLLSRVGGQVVSLIAFTPTFIVRIVLKPTIILCKILNLKIEKTKRGLVSH